MVGPYLVNRGTGRVSAGVRGIMSVYETKDGWYPDGIMAGMDLIE